MTWLEIALFIITLMVMLVGLAGIILPVVPGVPIIFAAALIYALITDFTTINGQTIIIFGILTIISILLDWLATMIGVKKLGGSYAGMIGAFIGMIIGLLLPGVGIFGFILTAFAGAFIFEWLVSKKARVAFKAGLGSFIGFIAGGMMRFVIGSTMIGVFVWNILF